MAQDTQGGGSKTDAKPKSNDVTGEVDINPAAIWERVDAFVDGFVRSVPNIAAAIVVMLLVWFLAKFVRYLIIKSANSQDRHNLGTVMGGFARAIITILGFFVAATIVVPSLNLGTLVSGLGISSVAIGFAFKDILQNWLAGLLILLRQPFQIGDQIKVKDFEGTVDHIETRATIIKTYDGQQIVVPNSEIYTNAVVVRTGYDLRRTQYDVGVGYEDNLDEAKRVMLDAISGIEGVQTDPAPEALTWDLAASWVNIRMRWWTQSDRKTIVQTKGRVILAIKQALDEAGIDMPYDTLVHLYKGDDMTTTNKPPAPKDDDPEADQLQRQNPVPGSSS